MSSLVLNRIGEAVARELLTALQFNKTLAELKWGWDVALGCGFGVSWSLPLIQA
jgi:hypothetical protein